MALKALKMLENREYDLIILDDHDAGMDGYQTAGRCGKRVMRRFYF